MDFSIRKTHARIKRVFGAASRKHVFVEIVFTEADKSGAQKKNVFFLWPGEKTSPEVVKNENVKKTKFIEWKAAENVKTEPTFSVLTNSVSFDKSIG